MKAALTLAILASIAWPSLDGIGDDESSPPHRGGCWMDECSSTAPLPLGAVAWWDSAELRPTDLPIAIDLIQPAANGITLGDPGDVTTAEAIVGSGFHFRRPNALLVVEDARKLHFGTGDFSMEMWVFWDRPANGTGQVRMVEKGRFATTGFALMIEPEGRQPSLAREERDRVRARDAP